MKVNSLEHISDMARQEPSLSLPPAIKTDNKKDLDIQHPLVAACMRPKKNFTATCEVCFIVFKQKKFLLEHQIAEHGLKPEWQCKVCHLVLSSKYNLECHMDRHKNSKKYKCHVCPASFNTRASQKRHFLYKHTDERPHQCSLCNFATVEHDKLKIHLRNHTGESPYKCDTCGMTFKTPIQYKRHVVVHTGWRQYLCVLCLKKYGTPVTVKQHMLTAHGVTRNVLTNVRNTREHGFPPMLAKFLENIQLGESETKMVNSLKYYEIQDGAAEEMEISNVDYSIFDKTKGLWTVDKSAFFILKSKNPVCFTPTEEAKSQAVEDSSLSGDEVKKPKKTSRRKQMRMNKKKLKAADNINNINSDSEVIGPALQNEKGNMNNKTVTDGNKVKGSRTSDSLKTSEMMDDFEVNKDGTKRNRNTEAKIESLTIQGDEEFFLQQVDEESINLLESLQANENNEHHPMEEPEIKRRRMSDLGQSDTNRIELGHYNEISATNDAAKDTKTGNADEDEESSNTTVFVTRERKSVSLKTPKLVVSPIKGKENEKIPDTASSPNKSSNITTVNTDSDTVTVSEDMIPYPTNFVSVVADASKEGTAANTCVTPVDEVDSETSNILKGGPPKSLPPFISLERCSDEHKERLLMGMKKGVFGPNPCVVRVLDDGSMINVSNLYKAYLPPSSAS